MLKRQVTVYTFEEILTKIDEKTEWLKIDKDIIAIKTHQGDSSFYVDENGIKHYVIDVKDAYLH